MPFVVACACGNRFEAPDAAAGKLIPCPACGADVRAVGQFESYDGSMSDALDDDDLELPPVEGIGP